jgi:branched-chain amino acid transport system permease protein
VPEGIRIKEHGMQVLGFPTYRYKLAVFTLADMFAGVAGNKWALRRGCVNPDWHLSAETLLMVLLGGLGTLLVDHRCACPYRRKPGARAY